MPRRARIRRPKLPSLPGIKAPDRWALTGGSARGYPIRELRRAEDRRRYPSPPPEWTGTEPEWAVFWALVVLGLQPDIDFSYRPLLPEIEARRWGEVDFLVWSRGIAIEVQGLFWHYHLGRQKMEQDEMKRVLVESLGLKMVWVDEDDVLADPIGVVEDALQGIDRSRRAT